MTNIKTIQDCRYVCNERGAILYRAGSDEMQTFISDYDVRVDYSKSLSPPANEHHSPQEWNVRLIVGFKDYLTTFTKGAAFRRWRRETQLDHKKPVYSQVFNCKTVWDYENTEREPPAPPEVLLALASDAQAFSQSEDIQEFADSFGYTKIKECLEAYNGCKAAQDNIIRLFGQSGLCRLCDIANDE